MMRIALGVAALALMGCPSKETHSDERAYREFVRFKDEMCLCKNKACADHVQEGMTKWATEMAKNAPKDRRPNEDLMKRMTDVGMQYGECMTKAMSADLPTPEPPPTPTPGDRVPKPTTASPNLPPPSYGTLWADRLWGDARMWARSKRESHVLASATFAYVDRHGALDAQDGEVTLVYGRAPEETKRKLGAKVRPTTPYDDCFQLSTTNGQWSENKADCNDAAPVVLRCNVVQIWKRALAKKVPEEALATVTLRIEGGTTLWQFVIDDEPRNVHISHAFADDCELAVEQ